MIIRKYKTVKKREIPAGNGYIIKWTKKITKTCEKGREIKMCPPHPRYFVYFCDS